MEETKLALDLRDRSERMDTIFRSSSNVDRQMLLMYCCRDIVWSRWTSRYFTDGLKGILFPTMFSNSLPSKLRRDVETAGVISVLLPFTDESRSSMHVSVPVCAAWNSVRQAHWTLPCLRVGSLGAKRTREGKPKYHLSDQLFQIQTKTKIFVFFIIKIRIFFLEKSKLPSHNLWRSIFSLGFNRSNKLITNKQINNKLAVL